MVGVVLRCPIVLTVVLIAGCGRGGFSGPAAATNDDDALADLVLTITDPAPGALVPRITTVRGVCSKPVSLNLQVSGDVVPAVFGGCDDGTFTVATQLVDIDGVVEVTVAAVGEGGAMVSDTRAFRRSLLVPVLTVDGEAELYTNTNTVTITGTCETDLDIVVSGAASTTLVCVDGVWSFTPSAITVDSENLFVFTQTNAAGNSTSATLDWIRDTQPPVIDAIVLNDGTTTATGNVLPLQIDAHDVGPAGIGAYRVSQDASLTALPWLPTVPHTVTFPLTSGSYTVRDGDTLSSIAASHGKTWRTLAQANGDVLSDPNMIFPGQTISMA